MLTPDAGWIGDSEALPCTGANGESGVAVPSGLIGVFVVLRQPAPTEKQINPVKQASATLIRFERRFMERPLRKRFIRLALAKRQNLWKVQLKRFSGINRKFGSFVKG